MTTIRVRCIICGDVDLEDSDVWILPETREYAFTCPECRLGNVKGMDRKIHALLRSAGCLYVDEIVAFETEEMWRALR